jgi:hypothetical protein
MKDKKEGEEERKEEKTRMTGGQKTKKYKKKGKNV